MTIINRSFGGCLSHLANIISKMHMLRFFASDAKANIVTVVVKCRDGKNSLHARTLNLIISSQHNLNEHTPSAYLLSISCNLADNDTSWSDKCAIASSFILSRSIIDWSSCSNYSIFVCISAPCLSSWLTFRKVK